jgi:hypothetical protein
MDSRMHDLGGVTSGKNRLVVEQTLMSQRSLAVEALAFPCVEDEALRCSVELR